MEYNDFLKHLEYSNSLRSFAKRISYFDSILSKIGTGSGRAVYDIDGTKVLKLAKNPKGISQNEVEVELSDYDDNKGIVTLTYNSDDENTWLIAEKAKKITPNRFKEIVGFDVDTVYKYVSYLLKPTSYKWSDEQLSVFEDSEFLSDMHDLCANHSVHLGDFQRYSSFGEVIRFGEPAIVVVDYGLNDEVYNTHYKKSMRIYELYNGGGNDDYLTNDNINNGDIINGGAGATSLPLNVDERVLSSMENSQTVDVKDECRLGGGKTCNVVDMNNFKLKPIHEDIEASEANDQLGTINTLIQNKRDIGFWVDIDPKYFKLINSNGIGLLPVERKGKEKAYILYKNKEKALELNTYLKTKAGYATDDTPDEARYVGKLLGYTDKTIEEYINRKYNKKMSVMNETEILTLNDLPFTDEINKIGGKIYSVGGAVRDKFLGKSSKDLDILITGVDMPTIESILVKYGKVDAVGKSFGILKFKPQGSTEDIDVAIPRTEVPTEDGGHKGFDVTSDHTLPIEKDLLRRDFTINAIAQDIDGTIIDPYNGVKDLKNKVIRIVNPLAFSDDPLRMLRAVQFSARFGFTIEPKTMKLIQNNASRIKEIPAERILGEFDKIIQKGDPINGIKTLVSTGVYYAIFGVQFGTSLIQTSKLQKISTMGEFIFALTYGKINNTSDFFKNNLSGDIDSFKLIKALELAYNVKTFNPIELRSVVHNMYVTSPNSLNSQILDDRIIFTCNEFLDGKYPKTVNELAVNGGDLMNAGLKGKEIGDMQKSLLVKIYSDKLRNDKEEILKLIGSKATVQDEGVADTYALNKWGIPDENIENEKGFLRSQELERNKPVGNVISRNGNYIPIYKNPKSLVNFEDNVRAIIDSRGDLYIAIQNEYFMHGSIAADLGWLADEYGVYENLDRYVLLHRIDSTTKFGLSDAYDGNHSGIRFNDDDIIRLMHLAKSKNPNFYFYNALYDGALDRSELVAEMVQDEGVADKYAANKFGIPDSDTEFEKQFSKYQEVLGTEPYGFARSGSSMTPIYKNPKSLLNFESGVRAISDMYGNIFIAIGDGNFVHGEIAKGCGMVRNTTDIYYDKALSDHVLLHRIGKTNKFGLGDTSNSYYKKGGEFSNQQCELLRKCKSRNPQFSFYNKYYSIAGDEDIVNEVMEFNGNKEKRYVLYSAVVLDEKSREKLIKYFSPSIPNGFEIIAHHMTINLGELKVENKQYLGQNIRLEIKSFAQDDKVVAIGCSVSNANLIISNKTPHITLAVNRSNGGKPVMSNNLTNWEEFKRPMFLTGRIEEIEGK